MIDYDEQSPRVVEVRLHRDGVTYCPSILHNLPAPSFWPGPGFEIYGMGPELVRVQPSKSRYDSCFQIGHSPRAWTFSWIEWCEWSREEFIFDGQRYLFEYRTRYPVIEERSELFRRFYP